MSKSVVNIKYEKFVFYYVRAHKMAYNAGCNK